METDIKTLELKTTLVRKCSEDEETFFHQFSWKENLVLSNDYFFSILPKPAKNLEPTHFSWMVFDSALYDQTITLTRLVMGRNIIESKRLHT